MYARVLASSHAALGHARSHRRLRAAVCTPAARPLHTTAPAAFLRPRAWRKMLKGGVHPTDQPSNPLKLTLFNQGVLPDDLQLPRPADPLLRLGAGIFDACVSLSAGAAAGGALHMAGADMDSIVAAGQGVALMSWVIRDGLGDAGNRSWGKQLFKLELTGWDGTLSTPSVALTRNWYFLTLPLLHLHPLFEMIATLPYVFDVASVLLTQDARKVGDYMLGSRVVAERPNRAMRIQDMHEAEEICALREEVEVLAPGFLEQSQKAHDKWYENVQDDMQLGSMFATEAASTARAAAAAGATSESAGSKKGGARERVSASATAGEPAAAVVPAAAELTPPELPDMSDLPSFLRIDATRAFAGGASAVRESGAAVNKAPSPAAASPAASHLHTNKPVTVTKKK